MVGDEPALGRSLTVDLEMLLLKTRAIEKLSNALRKKAADDDSDDDLEDDVGFVNTRSSAIRGGAPGRGQAAADSDESDLDM